LCIGFDEERWMLLREGLRNLRRIAIRFGLRAQNKHVLGAAVVQMRLEQIIARSEIPLGP
jgi:hypothetical protein